MTELTGVLAQVEAKCAELEEAMRRLRWGLDIPPVTAEGHDVHQVLLDVRARLDLAEQLLRDTRRERLRYRSRAAQRRHEADDAYDDVLDKLGEGAVRLEWQSGREREAKARLRTLDARKVARRAEAASAMVDDCYEALRDAFFGLLNIREELIARLRELQFESVLER